MADVYVPFATFKRLIKDGRQTGPIFESKETVLTSVGNLTVLASKPSSDRVFVKKNGFEERSFPFKTRGYMSISTIKEKMLDDKATIDLFVEEFRDYSLEALHLLREAIDKLLEKEA